MSASHISVVAGELGVEGWRVEAAARLLEEGATVPFISRYRKEATGSLDEVAVTAVRDRLTQLAELDKRREAILKSLGERDLLDAELRNKVMSAATLSALEDVYLPYRPKRRTRATAAREKGLEPLALSIYAQEKDNGLDPALEAQSYVGAEKGVETVEDALAGARDIIAEMAAEDENTRRRARSLFERFAVITSRVAKGKEEDGAKYADYFEWSEPAGKTPSHRMLAMRRGEAEKVLTLKVAPPEDDAIALVESLHVRGDNARSREVARAVADGYKRLLAVSMAGELRLALKKKADAEAIEVFSKNLRELLLAPPLGEKPVMAVDPGFRTGCKVVCLDARGKLLCHEAVFPHTGAGGAKKAAESLAAMCDKHAPAVVAVGNGTAGRETEAFIRGLDLPGSPAVVMVDEAGASVYSASEAARSEFPDHDVTVRGAVSIGRRLMDPLAELVKIDPKSIGVGQYQHDVDQAELKRALDDVVISCVNGVGVDLNTASRELLGYVSGLGPQLAANIVARREEQGPFTSRKELLEVPRLGPKAFEQAAGFLRIRDGGDPLDASAVHPESYAIVGRMAKDLGASVRELMADASLRDKIDPARYVGDRVGLPTLRDIMEELAKPGRDPRERFEVFSFAEGVNDIKDLEPGMRLPGIVTNVTGFGAFVDIGVHRDGLVHVSQMADRYVRDPAEVVKVRQKVMVTVTDIDEKRKRIGLSMKKSPETGKAD